MPPFQTISTGAVVAIVGFFSSFPIVLAGLAAMGADSAQAGSGLMAAALAMGLSGIALSLMTKAPVSVAWSTPGAALLVTLQTPAAGFAEATGAFLIAGVLTVIAALLPPLRKLVTAIPPVLAQAMLAGVLVSICIVPFQALASAPTVAAPILLTWFAVSRISRVFAVPAAVVAALGVTLWQGGITAGDTLITPAIWVTPVFTIEGLLGIALPLFIVTMATQNIPGLAIQRSYGFSPSPAPLLSGVGIASVLSAPFGAPATCLAAITAAMCCNPDCHPDPARRYWSAIIAGILYCLFGIFAVLIATVAAQAPALTLGTLAGIALMGVFAGSARAALEPELTREAAAVTFLVTASGMTALGLSAPVWGLLLGGLVYVVKSK